MSRDCEHGQLARSCNICDLERELKAVTQQRDKLLAAPEAEPFAVIHLDGSFVHVEFKQTIAGTGKFEVYATPPHQSEHHLEMVNTQAPSVPDGWRSFLTDVIASAGLLAHGKPAKACKAWAAV